MAHMGRAIRSSRGLLGALTLALLTLLLAGTALASHVEPEVVRGGPTCSDYSATGVEFTIHGNDWFGVEDSGTYTDGTLIVNVVFQKTERGQEFDWEANREIDVIVTRGGTPASIYRYDPPVSRDTGLHAPFNDTRSIWYASRYISFCYLEPEVKPLQPEETTTTAAVAATSQPKAETTTTLAPTTTIEAEVLPSVVTTAPPTSTTKPAAAVTTAPPEVLDTEVLPFTGMSDDTLWLLGLGLIAAGTTAVVSTRSSRRED